VVVLVRFRVDLSDRIGDSNRKWQCFSTCLLLFALNSNEKKKVCLLSELCSTSGSSSALSESPTQKCRQD
jgi:hypothetical protein